VSYEVVDPLLWEKCRLCGTETRKMPVITLGKGCYFSERFAKHVMDFHGLSLGQFFKPSLVVPTCLCGCGKEVEIACRGKDIVIRKYIRFHSTARDPGFVKSVEESKVSRRGAGNPMFGKTPWNNGKTKHTSNTMRRISIALSGKKKSEEHRRHISDTWNHSVSNRHSIPHTQETKDKLRQITLDQIKRGVFSQTRTKPHICFAAILDEIGAKYEEEKMVGFFSFDFYLPEYSLYVEVDGDYFHVNPLFYPDGPKTATQRINHYRDVKKNGFCKEMGLKMVRIWENDILHNRNDVVRIIREEIFQCTLRK
jgi:very-short-patch-repair endonuclease